MGSSVYLLSLAEGPDIVLDKPIMLFGRHPECDVLLNSKKISRKHCCIAIVGDGLMIRDLGSTNGVKVNGEKVNEGKFGFGDEVTIGVFSYKVSAKPADDKRPGTSKLEDDSDSRTNL